MTINILYNEFLKDDVVWSLEIMIECILYPKSLFFLISIVTMVIFSVIFCRWWRLWVPSYSSRSTLGKWKCSSEIEVLTANWHCLFAKGRNDSFVHCYYCIGEWMHHRRYLTNGFYWLMHSLYRLLDLCYKVKQLSLCGWLYFVSKNEMKVRTG